MALPSSGQPIKASDIRNEFGPFPTISLGAYRLQNQQLNTNSDTVAYREVLDIEQIPLDAGIPTSGEIKFSDFYDKRLNLIVDFYNHPTESIPIEELTRDITFTVYRQGDNLADAFATFTAQDGSGDTFTVTNKSSYGEKTVIRTVKKNVTYNVVFSEPNKVTQNGLIASSTALASTASDTGSHSFGGRILKLVAGTSKKAFGDRVGSGNDRDDMQITVENGIFTSGAGTRINQNGDSVSGAIDGFAGTENQRTTRPLTYRYSETISTTQGLVRKSIKTRYSDSSTIVVGGFTSKPDTSRTRTGTKVIAFVNQKIGSSTGRRTNVALKTGTWETGTKLEIVIGESGKIVGSGGDGGNGGVRNDSGVVAAESGKNGTSAIGIEHSPIIVRNKGYIQSGGGGGGGGNSYDVTERRRKRFGRRGKNSFSPPGGGGGGGSGFPPGNPGSTGSAYGNGVSSSTVSAKRGTLTTGGDGGTGTSTGIYAGYTHVAGLDGGSNGDDGSSRSTNNNAVIAYFASLDGDAGRTGITAASSATSGGQGRAIIVFNNGTGVQITNVGTGEIYGPTIYNTDPT